MKRYKEYKNSEIPWIGEVPVTWKLIRLKFLAVVKTGYTPVTSNEENFSDNGIIWVKPDNLNGFAPIVGSKDKISEKGIKHQNIIKKGSILLCCIGSIGKFGIAGVDLTTNQQINSITFNTEIISDYGKYLIFCCQDELNNSSNGNVVRILNTTSLKNIFLPTPSLEEQIKIATYLDYKTAQIDKLVSDKEKLIELLNEERTAIINQAVTKGLNPDVPMKDSGIEWLGNIPQNWKVKKVKFVLDCLNTSRIPLNSEERGGMSQKIYDYYGASGVIDKVENFLFSDDLILIGEDGANLLTRSKRLAFIARGKYWVNNHAHILKPKNGNLQYFCELLELIDYSVYVSGSAQPKLTQEALLSIDIVEPPIEEQNQISEYVHRQLMRVEEATGKVHQEIQLLKEYKTALVSEVVTGKVDVREEVIYNPRHQ